MAMTCIADSLYGKPEHMNGKHITNESKKAESSNFKAAFGFISRNYLRIQHNQRLGV
jgi:hypothetical protein